jgi:hypothetical protein
MPGETTKIVILFSVAAASAVWFLFLIRLIAALFSTTVRGLIAKRPRLHLLWGFLAFFCFVGVQSFLQTGWPPPAARLHNQIKILEERVQTNGGWEVLRQDCVFLMEQQKDEFHDWSWHNTNGLPASIAALKPMDVQYLPPQYLGELKDGKFTTPPKAYVVRIRVFGMPSTGGHAIPYLGLEVVMGDGAANYLPKPAEAASGNRRMHYKKITENIYEIY